MSGVNFDWPWTGEQLWPSRRACERESLTSMVVSKAYTDGSPKERLTWMGQMETRVRVASQVDVRLPYLLG